MDKTITIEAPKGALEIKHSDKGAWWELDEISLPNGTAHNCGGIWKDDAIFYMGKETDDYKLRMETDVLISILEQTKDITDKPDTHWWSTQAELHDKFKTIFGLNEIAALKLKVAELEEKIAAKKKK